LLPTNRLPLARQAKVQITQHAVELFKEYLTLKCTCPPGSRGVNETPTYRGCAGHQRMLEIWNELAIELRLPPDHFPPLQNPQNPYPMNDPRHGTWPADRAAQQLWKALAAAAG
jgi:hypothetical protein